MVRLFRVLRNGIKLETVWLAIRKRKSVHYDPSGVTNPVICLQLRVIRYDLLSFPLHEVRPINCSAILGSKDLHDLQIHAVCGISVRGCGGHCRLTCSEDQQRYREEL